jgi:apolipoprotein N-acyltransferase
VTAVQTPPKAEPVPPLRPRRRSVRIAGRLALAVVAGLTLLWAFPSPNLWFLAPVGVAALAWAVREARVRTAALLGLISGLVFFLPLLGWTSTHVGPWPWLLLCGLEALYIALTAAAIALVGPLVDRRPAWWPAVLGGLWVAQEALRGRTPFGGFPWGRLAFSQADAPTVRLAWLGGAPLVTFAVAAAGGLLYLAVRNPRPAVPKVAALIVGAAAVMAAGYAVPLSSPSGDHVTVAIVQGNVPRMGLDFNAQRRAVLDNHVQATLDLAARVDRGEMARPDLVIWPENSSDIDPIANLDAADQIDRAADAVGVPIIVGAVQSGPGENQSRNVGLVWESGKGVTASYQKQHPVPFAEYLPLRRWIEPIAKLVTDKAGLLRTDFQAGHGSGVITAGPARIGDVICFEIAYDGLVRDGVADGAQLLVVQTNNATFDVNEARQQLAMVRLRAVEHGRDSLMASTVGISGFVDTSGGVHDASGFFTRAVLVRDLQLGSGQTPATRLAFWPEAAMTAAVTGLVLVAAFLQLLRRRGRYSASGDATG